MEERKSHDNSKQNALAHTTVTLSWVELVKGIDLENRALGKLWLIELKDIYSTWSIVRPCFQSEPRVSNDWGPILIDFLNSIINNIWPFFPLNFLSKNLWTQTIFTHSNELNSPACNCSQHIVCSISVSLTTALWILNFEG